MNLTSPTFVILHGLDGSPAGHWQKWLEEELLTRDFRVQFPDLPEKEAPELQDWLVLLHSTIVDAGPNVTVVAHSLGAVLWMQYASLSSGAAVERVLLVAPPGLSELDELGRIRGHRSVSFDRERIHFAARTNLMAGSLQDPFCRRGFADEYSRPLDITPIYLPDHFRHVNIESGHGPWPFALRWSLVGTSFVSPSHAKDPSRQIFKDYPEPSTRRK